MESFCMNLKRDAPEANQERSDRRAGVPNVPILLGSVWTHRRVELLPISPPPRFNSRNPPSTSRQTSQDPRLRHGLITHPHNVYRQANSSHQPVPQKNRVLI